MTARPGAASLSQKMAGSVLVLAGFIGWGLALAQTSAALLPVPPPALVSDQTGTLTAPQLADLEARLRAFEQRKGSQLVLLMVASTQPEAIEPYALRVAEQWKLGRKAVDDGALLLVAKNDRSVRIEVGYGLEGVLSDAATKRIISEAIVPRFREGDFYGGINGALERMIRLIDGEALAPASPQTPQARPKDSVQEFFNLAPVLLVAVVVAGGVLRAAFGRLPGAALTAGGAGFIVWLLSGALGVAVLGAVLAFVATLLGVGSGHRGGLPGLGGGLHRGGGFGGGFGGGGGGFGGGGSSGRW